MTNRRMEAFRHVPLSDVAATIEVDAALQQSPSKFSVESVDIAKHYVMQGSRKPCLSTLQ